MILKFVIIAYGRSKYAREESERKKAFISEHRNQKEPVLIGTGDLETESILETYLVRSGLRISYESIVAIACPINFNRVFLLKVDRSFALFIESIDLDNNVVEQIKLDEKLDCWRRIFRENRYVAYDEEYKNDEQTLLYDDVMTFFVSDSMDYIFLKLGLSYPYPDDKKVLNIKVNLDGATLKKEYVTEFEGVLQDDDQLNELVVIPDYYFFNTNTFVQVDLYEFFDKFLDDEDFSYLRYTEDSCTMFSSRAKSLYAIVLFDRDGDDPRGTFCIFEIDGNINPRLIFKYKVDEYGMNHVFSENGKKIAYIYSWHYGEIELVLRSLNAEEFGNETRFTAYFSKKSPTAQKILLTDDDHIIIVFPDRFEIYKINEKKRVANFRRDQRAPYKLSNGKLFFIQNSRLRIHEV